MAATFDREDLIDAIAETREERFFGKYRGAVVDNDDPEGLGRIQVTAPAVMTTPRWAKPCAPLAGKGVGLFALPAKGTGVWVEFEAGLLRHPIWSGCYWVAGDLPKADAKPGVAFFKTKAGEVRLDDARGEVIVAIDGATITVKPGEIKIEAPTILNVAGAGKTQLSAAGFDAQQGAFKVV